MAVVRTRDSVQRGAALWAEFVQGAGLGGVFLREVFFWEKQVEVPASQEFPRVGGVGLARVEEVNSLVGGFRVREFFLHWLDGIAQGLPDAADHVSRQSVRREFDVPPEGTRGWPACRRGKERFFPRLEGCITTTGEVVSVGFVVCLGVHQPCTQVIDLVKVVVCAGEFWRCRFVVLFTGLHPLACPGTRE